MILMPLSAEYQRRGLGYSGNRLYVQPQPNPDSRFPNWRVVEKHPLRSIEGKPLSNTSQKPHYLHWLVNKFTYFTPLSPLHKRWYPFCRASSMKRAPHRTVRRVHVMPWATPIRRIGSTRVDFYSQENDDPAGFAGRRG